MLRVAKKRFLRGLISFYFAKVAIFAYKSGCFKTCGAPVPYYKVAFGGKCFSPYSSLRK